MRSGFEGDEDRTDMAPSKKKKTNKKVEAAARGVRTCAGMASSGFERRLRPCCQTEGWRCR